MNRIAVVLLLLCPAAGAQTPYETAQQRWQQSPHGELLKRILPPRITPEQLPEPTSRGAQLVASYCVQCHHLPNPAMHDGDRWDRIVDRTLPRMRGQGNRGKLMSEMMQGARPLGDEEVIVVKTYLRKHAQTTLTHEAGVERPQLIQAIAGTRQGEAFRVACSQCHALPDPLLHTAGEWPDVVARMQENMAWMNRVVPKEGAREPQLKPEDIVAFLSRHAKR